MKTSHVSPSTQSGKRTRRLIAFAVLLASGALIVACSSATDPQPGADSDVSATNSSALVIDGTSWKIDELNGHGVSGTGESHFLRFESGRLSAKAGCNSIGADYKSGTDGSLTLSPAVSTKMACENMADETALIKVLEGTTSASLVGGNLVLTDGTTELAVLSPIE